MITRLDFRTSQDPTAVQLAEEVAEGMSLPTDEGDAFGWGASMAEDRERRWLS